MKAAAAEMGLPAEYGDHMAGFDRSPEPTIPAAVQGQNSFRLKLV